MAKRGSVTLKAYLMPEIDLYADLTITISISPDMQRKAEANGVGPEELKNLMEQKSGELRQLLGNTDEI